jgi:multidrug efflux pump subunit AcrA (membrane-fusion protein)
MGGMKRRGVVLLVAAGALAALATAGYVYSTNRKPATRFRTATVDRGTIVATVSATGALAAVTASRWAARSPVRCARSSSTSIPRCAAAS